MKFFLKFIDVWFVIESGFKAPEWSNIEKLTHMTNDKAMNALCLSIS